MKFEPKELKETQDISRGKQTWHEHAQFLLTVALVLVGGYLLLGVVADQLAMRIPNELEQSIFGGDQSAEESGKHPRFESVKAIFNNLRADPQVRKLDYRLIEISMPEANAFAMPGGVVALSSGLLQVVKSDVGVAMVLGHELGHHAHRHTLKQLGRGLLNTLVLSALSFDRLFGDLASVAERRHSQAQERQADHFGMHLISRVYDSTDGALEFFEWAQKEESETQRLAAWLHTHPLGKDRIARLKKIAQSIEASKRD